MDSDRPAPRRRRGKTQPRTFDYAEARRLRWVDGMPVWWIADHFGVTVSAIYYACSAERRAYKRRKQREHVERRAGAAVG